VKEEAGSGLRKIGLYGGTFDPIHHGHLILARAAVEALGLDRVFFIPNSISPHKLSWSPEPAGLRAEMIAAAIAGEPRFELDDCEIRRGGPSYTIDTVLLMEERFEDAEFYVLIGGDNTADLSTWHRIEELALMAKFVVFTRGGERTAPSHIPIERRIEISSTDIRARAAAGKSIRYLVPEPVRKIIREKRLYMEPSH
jgi:nicotinate-nucleotide adenylyltransferase